MDMLTAPGFYPFTIAALILVGLVTVEVASLVLGLSVSTLVDDGLLPHTDHGDGLLGPWMSWLNTGGVPLLVLLMIVLAAFAVTGLSIQAIAQAVAAPLPTGVAGLGALGATVPVTRLLSRWIGRVFPRDETAAVSQAEFIGTIGTVTLGPLDDGHPGRVRIKDRHDNVHVLRARAAPGHVIAQGALVVVVGGADGLFEAIPAPDELSPIS
ncbi:OB-fold-containig protein [Chelatococcus reniformis]|uniref:Membrane protein n=1 Tax=Chelatococcus reniformis TaxID=1494448 RepID=A0A916XDY3_9HYPH|nr:OB-fold-containig protein [Chelatococcus reniformis]GGC66456.1 membrane protein [Chelatococcus reniformis]